MCHVAVAADQIFPENYLGMVGILGGLAAVDQIVPGFGLDSGSCAPVLHFLAGLWGFCSFPS